MQTDYQEMPKPKEQKLLPPTPVSIYLIGTILIMIGVCSIYNIIFSALNKSLNVDMNFLALILGFGIIEKKDTIRFITVILSLICMIIIFPASIIMFLFDPRGLSSTPQGIPQYIIIAILLFAPTYTFITLRTKKILTYFRKEDIPDNSTCERNLSWGIIIATALIMFPSYYLINNIKNEADNIHIYETRIEPYDTHTGKGIDTIKFTSDIHKMKNKINLSNISKSYMSSSDGAHIKISGYSPNPITIKIEGKGYKSENIIIDNKSESTIRVPMTPIPTEQTDKEQ